MIRMSRYVSIVFILCLIFSHSDNLFGQNKNLNQSLFIIGARAHYAFIIQHTPKLKDEITQSKPWSVEVDLNWHLRRRSVWDYCYCYPRTGISVMYTDFALPRVLGSAVSIYPFIEPFIRPEKRLNFAIRFGIGPAFMTKPYDDVTNPDNLFFSSTLSFVALLNFSANYRITDQLSFRLAGNYNHISNSGYREPNLGINFPSVNAGFDYSLKTTEFEDREKDPGVVLNPKKNRVDFVGLISAKPTRPGKKEKRYPVYGLTTTYSRVVGRIFALTACAEWVNDLSLKEKIREDNIVDESGDYPDHNRIGALAGVEWLFGRFIFYQQFGCYLYAPVEAKNKLYQRYGLNFKITNHIYTGLNIKAHGQDADFMDLRVGFYL